MAEVRGPTPAVRTPELPPSYYSLAVATLRGLSYYGFGSPASLQTRMGDFGSKFRAAREKKNLSLDDVSNVTKISARMLKAIEEEHFDQLPGGVFNKGFVRAYAKHLGLNDEEAVSDYLVCLREAQIAQEMWDTARPDPVRAAAPTKVRVAESRQPAAVAKPPAPTQVVEELPELQLPRVEDVLPPRKEFRPREDSGFPWMLVGVVAVIIAAVIFFWTRHSRSTRAAASSVISHVSPPSAAMTDSSGVPHVSPPLRDIGGSSTQAAKSTPKPSQPAVAPNRPATPTPASATELAAETSPRRPAPAAASSAEKPSLTLVIRATENSWVSVQADGQLATQETLIAPANTSVHARREIIARIGNAAGVTFLFNGREVPVQGAEAEVKTFVFDSTGMHPLASPVP